MTDMPTSPTPTQNIDNNEAVYVNGVATPFLPAAALNKPEVVKPKVFNTAMIISFSAFIVGLMICGLIWLSVMDSSEPGSGLLLVWFVVMFQIPVTIATMCIFIQSLFRKIAPKKT